MKKVSHHLMLILFGCFFLASCEKDDSNIVSQKENSDVKVIDGRLVFSGKESFINTINLLGNKDKDAIDQWEANLGHTSLRSSSFNNSSAIELIDGLVPRISILLNKNNIVQIGDEILYLKDSVEYIIPNEKLNLLKEVKEQLVAGNKINIASVKVVPIKTKKVPLKVPGDSTSSLRNARTQVSDYWVDSRYQYPFNSPGGTKMKFRFSAEVSSDDFGTYIQTISVLEYYKVRTIGRDEWLQAGESAAKYIRNLSVSFRRDGPYQPVEYYAGNSAWNSGAYITNGDGFNNNSIGWGMAIYNNHIYDLVITGDYHSVINQPGWPASAYRVSNVYWFLDHFQNT